MSDLHSSRARRGFIALATAVTLAVAAFASDATPKKFDVPAGQAAAALKEFSRQAGVEVLYPADAVADVRTNATQGDLTPRAALERMVAGTGFIVVQDEKTGALGLRQEPGAAKKSDSRLVSTETANADGSVAASRILKLEDMRVLGSRIRQVDSEGPSPVSTYNQEYIKSTGAFTLSDFLNQIPQTYSGIASGRSSTPNELNPEFGQRTETTTPAFNFVVGSSASPPGQTGVSGVSLRGLGSGSTLVLVDGRRATQSGAGNRSSDTRQGFVDLNTIPLGMIERVEVLTDGASAIYGADAVAGVINIILKQNYSGTEISGGYRTAEHGGGRERNVSIMHGFAFGKLSGTVSIEYFDRQNLKASQRSFSADQNHTDVAVGILTADGSVRNGTDYRLNWGFPAVIQASGGLVSGTFDAIPGIRVVAVPVGSASTPTLAQFERITTPAGTATVVNASAQRRFNTAAFLDLVPEAERTGFSGNFKYKFNPRLEAYLSLRTSDSRSLTEAQIAGNSITGSFGTPAVLLAANNPFNQNVQIGMVLPEWGSASQKMRTMADAATAGVRGSFADTWQWDLGASWQNQKTREYTRNFNGAGFANLLNNADPTKRFNPFIDYTAPGAPSQAALLETLSTYPFRGSEVTGTAFDFSADGNLFGIWGGDVKMAFGGSTSEAEVESRAINYSAAAVPVATQIDLAASSRTNAAFVEMSVPIVGKPNARTLVRRLDLQLAGRYEEVDSFSKTVPKVGLSWAPLRSLLLRGSWSQGFRAPGATEYLVAPSTVTSTLSDPRRTPASTTGILVLSGSNPAPQMERSENNFYGIVFEPPFVEGLSFQVNYYDTVQNDVLQLLSAQTIVNNEALFPDRIIRAAANATDISLNQPGQITNVSRVFVNFGEVVNRSLDFVVDYRLPWKQFGNWQVNLAASHTLEATRALAPGQPPVILEDDTAAPPQWKFNTAVFWNKGPWNASAFLWYLDGFAVNSAGNVIVANTAASTYYPTPAVSKLDLRLGYTFENGILGGIAKGMRVGVGVNNVFDKEPPFSNTVWGFNAGLHSNLILGRAYELSFVMPF